jgi:hypothetical protein
MGRLDFFTKRMLTLERELIAELQQQAFDLAVVCSIEMVPLALAAAANHTRLLLDAREYYPKNFDDQWVWRLTRKPVMHHLCRTYLHRCHKITTVSDGLARAYAHHYGVQAEVLWSLPVYHDLEPTHCDPAVIRMIHHGNASRSRRIGLMIDMMNHLDRRFQLDLMLIRVDDSYWSELERNTDGKDNVRIIPPVPMHDIVRFTNRYDIGLFLCPPVNFNLQYSLPNKLFEFIQARLAVSIGPSPEMARVVRQYHCGIIAKDFSPRCMAEALRSLTVKEIMHYKQQSHEASHVLHDGHNRIRILALIESLMQ